MRTSTAASDPVRIVDSTLRDGSHALSHQFTEGQVRAVVHALDAAGVPAIEVSHGDGLGGSSFNYGFGLEDEIGLVAAAVQEASRAEIAVRLVPGVSTIEDLRAAHEVGAGVARIATYCTEADVSVQHFRAAADLGMRAVGFLMFAHHASPRALARQARIMVDSGAECVYVADSAGALALATVQERVAALVREIGADAEVGFHGHQNLSLGVANSVLAYHTGARWIDGALCSLGAGAGNASIEVLVPVFERLGVPTGVDGAAVLAAAADVVAPMVQRAQAGPGAGLPAGQSGGFSSFLRHAQRAANRYDIPVHEIMHRVGEAGYVGGQEDVIIDVALRILDERDAVGTVRSNR
ncbi:MAG TPA: 4-hydroxy-2-oxovalerate aldolase [Mycobacteriales bacterium]|nr:4-hydroxy-2-oxovalerate aldolase [Mycobacteriales bacterium]